MSLILNKPYYNFEPIRNIPALARALKTDESYLRSIASKANISYSIVPPEPGSTRKIFNAHSRLKAIHKKIKDEILGRVIFPKYLNGSIKGRDYVTNAKMHSNKRVLNCEDVKKFFPSVCSDKVQDIWQNFFGFSEEVAKLLTEITTKDGALPQGAIPSSYLANLVLWRDEPLLCAKLAERGITYSRYVDDMAISADRRLNKQELTSIIANVYGMLRKNGLSAGRKKHEFFTASEPMITTKLIVNRKPSLPKNKRSQIRAQVFQLEQRIAAGNLTAEVGRMLDNAAHKVGQLGRFHQKQATDLKNRINAARNFIYQQGGISFTTTSQASLSELANLKFDESPPWR